MWTQLNCRKVELVKASNAPYDRSRRFTTHTAQRTTHIKLVSSASSTIHTSFQVGSARPPTEWLLGNVYERCRWSVQHLHRYMRPWQLVTDVNHSHALLPRACHALGMLLNLLLDHSSKLRCVCLLAKRWSLYEVNIAANLPEPCGAYANQPSQYCLKDHYYAPAS